MPKPLDSIVLLIPYLDFKCLFRSSKKVSVLTADGFAVLDSLLTFVNGILRSFKTIAVFEELVTFGSALALSVNHAFMISFKEYFLLESPEYIDVVYDACDLCLI
jgi:hypothetical protein